MIKLAIRLLCLVRLHDWRWTAANVNDDEPPPESPRRRECRRCGLRERWQVDHTGWSSGDWLPY